MHSSVLINSLQGLQLTGQDLNLVVLHGNSPLPLVESPLQDLYRCLFLACT